ncbi:expressed protein [Pseudozyma hubeiensis SY62]|uniref:Expressed protein n=1 Tax=Pseudozyma hubeiensis (strain SY62) TaxID=1305764 RepID=R9P909_PSEHS|nr:expressed protein [Pseudozyma hubeiensis SY62]GAC97858.1 expressed protein [Pseudozyma hubeiensis SY62]
MSTSSSSRTLSLHERYASARRCVNSASVVCVAAILQLDPAQQEDTIQSFDALRRHLTQRIDHVLEQFPLLGYCVQASRSKTPRWAPVVPAPTSKDILHVGTPMFQQGTKSDTSALLSKAILEEQLALPKTTQLEKGPLWRVQLVPIRTEQGDTSSCLLVLATDHVINDGRGTLNLFQLLLQSSPSSPSHPPTAIAIPPASDKIFSFHPSASYLLGEVWRELILPKLPFPKKLKAKLKGPESWPASSPSLARKRRHSDLEQPEVVRTPKECKPDLELVLVSSPRLISNIKALSKAHLHPKSRKPATIHSIIHTLSLVALYAAISRSHSSDVSQFKLNLGSATPISLREEESPSRKRSKKSPHQPLPVTSGNYVSSFASTYRLSARETFWTFTHRFSTSLSSPRGQRLAKQHMGLLAYIPDFETKPREEEDQVESALGGVSEWDGKYRNGWEKFFGDRASSSAPFDSALTENLSIALSTRPDAFADNQLFQRFKRYLRRLVLDFAAENVTVEKVKSSQESHQEKKRIKLDLTQDITFATLVTYLIASE